MTTPPDRSSERNVERIQDTLSDLGKEMVGVQTQMSALKSTVEQLITRAEFAPVRLLVYGLTGSTLAGVVGAVMSKVLTK